MTGPLRIGALISGGGRTLLNLADQIDAGALDARIAVVISSRASAPGVARHHHHAEGRLEVGHAPMIGPALVTGKGAAPQK